MEANSTGFLVATTNSHGGNLFLNYLKYIWRKLFSFQSKQKHHVHPRRHSPPKQAKKTLKPPTSYLVPNPKFHHQATEKSSANSSVTVTVVELDAHSTLNPVYEYSEEINTKAERDFKERGQHLQEVCERSNIVGKYSPNAWEFFISPGHGLAWCNVFKAASTTWMYYFNILGEKVNLTWFEMLNFSLHQLATTRNIFNEQSQRL